MVISNVKVFGLEDAIIGSKYPMSTDVTKCTAEITPTVKKLGTSPKGEGHDTFLNGIVVEFDLTFSIKAWTEAERYSHLNYISSESTIHRIAKFDYDKQYIEYVDPRMVEIMKELRDKYNETQDPEDYLKLLYSNPCGFKLTAKMVTNYRQLKTIYAQRKSHKLYEWRSFCEEILQLPHFKELCLGETDE